VFLNLLLRIPTDQTGYYLSGIAACAAIFQVGVVPRLLRRWGDRNTALAGWGLYSLGFAALLASQALPAVLAGAALALFGVVTLTPVLPAVLTKVNRALQEGELMGLNQSTASLGQIVGPLLGYSALYAAAGAGYVAVCLALSLVAALLFVRLKGIWTPANSLS
jgi:MFS family permease